MGLEEAQVAEVYVPASGGFGTGYLISPRLVLTARHVVAPSLSDRGVPKHPAGPLTGRMVGELAAGLQRCRLRLLSRTAGRPFHDAVAVWWHDDVDAVLLAVLDTADATWEAPPLSAGMIWADLAGPDPVDCLAAGFPVADAQAGVRESRELVGTILPLSQYKAGHMVIHGLGTIGQPLAGATSAWAGMSGAAVFADGLLIGVLRCDADPSDPRRMELWAEPARTFADDVDFVGWLCADGGRGAWTRSPVSPQQRIRLRGLTHGHGTSSARLLTRRLRSGPIPAVSVDDGASGSGFGARLVGRGSLLAELHAAFLNGENAADRDTLGVAGSIHDARVRPRMRVLTGIGGVGKTSLAAGYVARYGEAYGLVAWLSAASPTALRADFARLLSDLEVAIPEDGDPVAAAHDLLAARPDHWLVVFDNAHGQAELGRMVPDAGSGAVLVTSVNPAWVPRSLVREVGPLDTEAAVRLLLELSGDDDEVSARLLADQLGGLPLALEQAGAYVDASGGSIAEYLGLWRNSRRDLLARGGPLNHPDTVLATWQLAVDGAVSQEPAALGLLRLLSCYAPNLIPLAVLADADDLTRDGGGDENRLATSPEAEQVASELAPLRVNPLRVQDAVTALRRYSLLRRAGDLVSLHRLVQAIALDHLDPPSRSAWLAEAARRLQALTPPDPGDASAWPRFAQLLPHAVALAAGGADPAFALVFCSYLSYRHDPAAMLALATQIAAASGNSVSPEQTRLRAEMSQIEARFRESGDARPALAMASQLLPHLVDVLGPDHPDTLRTRNSIAVWTEGAGDAAGAIRLFAALLADRERVLGPDHPDTLRTRGNLAAWTGKSGDAAGAIRLSAALLADQERILGPDHPDTLRTRAFLATWTGRSGDTAGATRLFAALLADRERVLGPDHPDTLDTRAGLAYMSGKSGDTAGAARLFAALLADQERILGPDHPNTLRTRAFLAFWTGKSGDTAGAIPFHSALSAPSPIALRADFAVPDALFDNAHGQAELGRMVPDAGSGAVLVTSVNPAWVPRSLVREVGPLDTEAAVRLLLELSGDDDEVSARLLADQLGGLPLALEQAGAYVDASGGSIAEYLGLWRNSRRDLLARGGPLNHPDTVLATWQLAVDGAVSQEPAALGLLRLLSCYAPNLIPLAVLADADDLTRDGGGDENRLATSPEAEQVASELAPLRVNPLRVQDAVTALRRYSLLRRAGDLVSLHRLVQAIALDHLDPPSRSAWLAEAARRLQALTPPDPGDASAWPRFAQLLPHAVALAAGGADPAFALVFCSYLSYRHDPAAMLALATQIAAASGNSVSPEQTRLRAEMSQIEARFRESGDARPALAMASQLLPHLVDVLGPDHPDTLRTRNSIAVWTEGAGDAAGAIRLFAALLADRERVLGPDHPDTLRTRGNLAAWTGKSGDAAGAIRLSAALLADQERILGPDHPDTLRTRAFLATWTGRSGDTAGATRLFAALLADRERVLGPDHPDTLDTRAGLAYMSGKSGDTAGAARLFAALLADQERILGPDHPNTLRTRAFLAFWTSQVHGPN